MELEDDFEDKLRDAIEVEEEVRIDELLSNEFMQSNTDFESLVEFFDNSPWDVPEERSVADVAGDDLDQYVDEETCFESFEEMREKAAIARLSD